jgi:hypothetical protein
MSITGGRHSHRDERLSQLNIREPWATSAQPQLKPSFFHSYCLKTGPFARSHSCSGVVSTGEHPCGGRSCTLCRKKSPKDDYSNPAHESAELGLFSRNPKAKRNVEPYWTGCLPYFQVYGVAGLCTLTQWTVVPESIECFIEKQASSPSSDDLAPPPSLSPLFHQQVVSFSQPS